MPSPRNIAKKSRKIKKPTGQKSVKNISVREVIETCSTNQTNGDILTKLKACTVRLKDINVPMPLKKNHNSTKSSGPNNSIEATSLSNYANENIGEKQIHTVWIEMNN